MTVVSVDTAQHGAIGIFRASGPYEHTLEASVCSHVLVTEELHRHGDQPAGYTQPRLSPPCRQPLFRRMSDPEEGNPGEGAQGLVAIAVGVEAREESSP